MSTGKKRKPRSPAVPSRSLRDCFDDVKRLYERYTHAAFSKVEIASALDMSARSGPFGARMYTLKEFGLIEAKDGNYQVSQIFKTLNSNPPESDAFKEKALQSIRGADIFRSLLEEFKNKLPQQSAVAQRLETQYKFNPEKAKIAANVLESSLRFAGVLDHNNNILPIRSTGRARAESLEQEEDQESGGGEQREGRALRLEIPLENERKVTILYPNDISKNDVERVSRVIKAIVE